MRCANAGAQERLSTESDLATRAAAGTLLSVTADNFNDFLEFTSSPVLFDFWAPWCTPCRELEPVLRSLAVATRQRLVLAKVNIDMHIEVAKRFGVRSVPTLLLLRQGQEVARFVNGSYTLERLQQELQPYLG